ncbi:MAG: hypothetical protein K0R25_82 [Rickettsiaceae bacterium]|jgi:ubiquinone biosynthesis protein COQ9|nr:hypothetical protein [Rickettsiaceae bacterium]
MLIDSIENKQKILHHFLELCVLDGWNDGALRQACEDAGIDVKLLPLIFENGCIDIADFFVREVDEKMKKEAVAIDFSQMKIRDKIKNLVKLRLKINEEYKPQLANLIHFYRQPKNLRFALTNSYKAADLMWNLAGDNATDFNFYTKRLILAKIYIRVLICFARDESRDNQKTMNLLDQEIEKVMKFGAFKHKLKNNFEKFDDCLKKAGEIKNDFFQDPKNLIKKLPFFRLYK